MGLRGFSPPLRGAVDSQQELTPVNVGVNGHLPYEGPSSQPWMANVHEKPLAATNQSIAKNAPPTIQKKIRKVGSSQELSDLGTEGVFYDSDKGASYTVKPENWFTALPYGFRFYRRDKDLPVTMFLPINPTNLTISTNFATNIIPTLYGTIEEHSPVRYYDIVIEGTTGMVPKWTRPFVGSRPVGDMGGRLSSVTSAGFLDAVAGSTGFFAKTLATLNKAYSSAKDLFSMGKQNQTGVFTDQTGYFAFHNLYRFFLKYKMDAAGQTSTKRRTRHPLTFFNYKDNNEYDVAIENFTLRRSSDNPMLYQYRIQLRGFNLRNSSDEFAAQDQTADRLNKLGLNGTNSLLNIMKTKASQAKSVLGSLGAGLKVLGK